MYKPSSGPEFRKRVLLYYRNSFVSRVVGFDSVNNVKAERLFPLMNNNFFIRFKTGYDRSAEQLQLKPLLKKKKCEEKYLHVRMLIYLLSR